MDESKLPPPPPLPTQSQGSPSPTSASPTSKNQLSHSQVSQSQVSQSQVSQSQVSLYRDLSPSKSSSGAKCPNCGSRSLSLTSSGIAFCPDCNMSSQIDIDDEMQFEDVEALGVRNRRGLAYRSNKGLAKSSKVERTKWMVSLPLEEIVEKEFEDVLKRR